MKSRPIIVLMLVVVCAGFAASAQEPGEPTYHSEFSNLFLFGGYQHLNHPTGVYHVATFQTEVLYSFFGARAGLTVGPDYVSFSPFGLLLFAPRIFMKTVVNGRGADPGPALALMVAGISAGQWHIPITDHVEVSLGWDALKFTKMKDIGDHFDLQGSLNAGLICYLGDNWNISAYYEYNHPQNWLMRAFNFMTYDAFGLNANYPSELKGHSFGFRIGYMFW